MNRDIIRIFVFVFGLPFNNLQIQRSLFSSTLLIRTWPYFLQFKMPSGIACLQEVMLKWFHFTYHLTSLEKNKDMTDFLDEIYFEEVGRKTIFSPSFSLYHSLNFPLSLYHGLLLSCHFLNHLFFAKTPKQEIPYSTKVNKFSFGLIVCGFINYSIITYCSQHWDIPENISQEDDHLKDLDTSSYQEICSLVEERLLICLHIHTKANANSFILNWLVLTLKHSIMTRMKKTENLIYL